MKRLTILFVFLCLATGLLLSPPAMAQRGTAQTLQTRDTPLAKIHAAFLQAYNTGDRDSIRQFVINYYSERLRRGDVMDNTNYLLMKYAQHGPLEFKFFQRIGGDKVAWMRGTVSNFWLGVEITLTEQAPYNIKQLSTLNNSVPKLVVNGPLPPDSLAATLDSYLETMEALGLFSGVVLVAKNGHTIYEQAVGWANKRSRRPNRLDTRFALASITKSITAATILRLKDQGRLELDDPLEQYVPEYPDSIATAVTIRDLLTHQSGIELDYFRGINEAKGHVISNEELLELHLTYLDSLRTVDPGRSFPLGEFDYSNEGYDLLGLIINRVTGKPYPEAVRDLVLRPAGMLKTGFLLPNHPVLHFATPQYSSLSREAPPRIAEVRAAELDLNYPMGSGSMYSTAGDLARFVYALTQGNLLKNETFESATTSQVPIFKVPPFQYGGYGYGLEVAEIAGLATFGHGGATSGVSTNFIHFPETGYTVVVLSNYSFVGHGVFNYVLDLVTPVTGVIEPTLND